ncbi:APC family permease [Microbacterium sp. NPDC077184]|uniref:APC family permease n=1 Tax=Microbacterium sp. NPDC077184 TaxID=3154764 RepID=UPI00341D5D51
MSNATERHLSPPQMGETKLKANSLGFIGVAFFVISAAAPMAAFVGASPVIFSIMGPVVPLIYVLVALVIAIFAIGYLKMSRHVVSAGGFVSYIARGLGRNAATGAAGIVIVTYIALQVGLWSQFGVFAQQLAASYLGIDMPVWFWVLIFLAATTALTMFGVDLNLRILGVLLVLEVVAVAVLVIGVFANSAGRDLSLVSFAPSGLFQPGLGVAVLFVFACFTTFEATTVFSEEAREPRRTIPRALFTVIVFVGVFYTLATWAVSIAVGPDNIQEAAGSDLAGIIFAISRDFVGPWLDILMQVLVVSSFIAMLIGVQNMFARYMFALARARALPRPLATVTRRSQAPARAALVNGVIVGVILMAFLLSGADPITVVYAWFLALGTIGFVVMMAFASIAIVVFFIREKLERGFWTTRVAPFAAVVLMVSVLVVAIANYDALLFDDGVVARAMLWSIPIAFALGALLPVVKKDVDFGTVVSAGN